MQRKIVVKQLQETPYVPFIKFRFLKWIIGGVLVGKRYCFYCSECELKLTLYKEVGKNSKNQLHNYYCKECEKITFLKTCRDCGQENEKTLQVPKNGLTKPDNDTESIECPKCSSLKTALVFLGEWE